MESATGIVFHILCYTCRFQRVKILACVSCLEDGTSNPSQKIFQNKISKIPDLDGTGVISD